jgi:ribosomal protein S18 acetylase RimI-like enzyme
VEAERHASQFDREKPDAAPTLRNAQLADAPAIATVLAHAFPSLYQSTFGIRELQGIVSLLQLLYEYGHLSLDDTRVCEIDGTVVAVMILHTGQPVGRGPAARFWRLLRERFGLLQAPRLFFGGVTANLMLNKRIPNAPELVYIEALAVAEPFRGHGIGSQLLADAEAWARARGRTRLALHVLVNNSGARRLYERTGFRLWREREPESPWQSALPPSPWSAILLTRELDG